jgi:hypothetical protein
MRLFLFVSDVHHYVILPSFRESLELLQETLDNLGRYICVCVCVCVCLCACMCLCVCVCVKCAPLRHSATFSRVIGNTTGNP